MTCQRAGLEQIPLNLVEFLRTTDHPSLSVDLTGNALVSLPCSFLRIPTIITLILTNNRIQSLPACFSHSSIQTLVLTRNSLRFNRTNLLSSRKLLSLDLSHNELPSLPSTFLSSLPRLRTLIIDGEHHLLEQNNEHWLRAIPTRNQLTVRMCDPHLPLSLCLFHHLFQSHKLLAVEIHSHVYCDCSVVYLPADRIHFQSCSLEPSQCDERASRFAHGRPLSELATENYRRQCADEFELCQGSPGNGQPWASHEFRLPSSDGRISTASANESITTTTTTVATSPKKENRTAGAIIPFLLLLLIVTIVCLYVILSGQCCRMRASETISNYIIKRRKQSESLNGMPSRDSCRATVLFPVQSKREARPLEERASMENVNMNSIPQRVSFQSYYHHRPHEREDSYSDDGADLTFYSILDSNDGSSSVTTEVELRSSAESSFASNDTVIVFDRNKQNIYS